MLSIDGKSKERVVVSLTTFPKRIDTVNIVIESLLNQTVLPDKIYLWLGEDEFLNKEKDLPQKLLNLQSDVFEICWCKDIKSYKKLIPTLKKDENAVIITADDDVIYENRRIEILLNEHKKHPKDVICHRAHYITFKDKNTLDKYNNWIFNSKYSKPTYNLLLTGVGMVLYPVNCFYGDIFREDLFMTLSSGTDDIWFWAMCVLAGTKIRKAKKSIKTLKYVDLTQEDGLYFENVLNGRNDTNMNLMLKHYPELLDKLSYKKPCNILSWIFSITNFSDKTHKVVKIFGLQIKFKRKLKNKVKNQKKSEENLLKV
ncbi:hypothetical protein IJ670_04155 [bacterium]|nr:hypothetical protein [bacterium]